MRIELRLNNDTGILGIERPKGLFVTYKSYEYGEIELQFFKSKSNNLHYYLVDNQNISNYMRGYHHDDIMRIHNKIEKCILRMLRGEKSNFEKEFRFKKYENDENDFDELRVFISDNFEDLENYMREFDAIHCRMY